MDFPAPPALSALALDGRLPALLVGLLLLAWGERTYRVLIIAPGVLAGLYLAAWLRGLFHFDTIGSVVATVGLSGAGALLCHFVEGLAVRAAGAGLFAAVAWFGTPLVHAGPVPWWAPVIGVVVGALLFPKLYGVLLRPLTALVGAWSVAWAVHLDRNLYVVLGLAAVGAAVQFALARRGGEAAAASPPPKKKGKKK